MELKNKSLFRQECFIGGKWVKSSNGEKIEVDNPATQKSIGSVPKCGKNETKNAIDSANNAFINWKNKTAKERSIILKNWQDLIIKNLDDLAYIMTVEQGKPLAESKGEILMGASYIEFYAEEVKRVYGDIIPDPLPD